MNWIVRTWPDWAAVVIRIALAVVFFPHGAQKVLGWFGGRGFGPTMEGFSHQYGPALAFLAIAAEFAGPIGLFLGFPHAHRGVRTILQHGGRDRDGPRRERLLHELDWPTARRRFRISPARNRFAGCGHDSRRRSVIDRSCPHPPSQRSRCAQAREQPE